MSAPSAEEVAHAAAAVAEIEWNAAVRCQRAFRQRVARRREIADQLRHLIFGPAVTTATATLVRENPAPRSSNIGDGEASQLPPAEYAASWKPDNDFRDALAINVLDGYEQLYLRCTYSLSLSSHTVKKKHLSARINDTFPRELVADEGFCAAGVSKRCSRIRGVFQRQ